ncbi:MAG TPA: patatin-like phospholipase family protein [Aldersonia sp.]
MLWAGQIAGYVTVPAISPYLNPGSSLSLDYLRSLLEKWIDFEHLNRVDADPPEPSVRPMLVLGAVEVESGVFKAFDSRRGEITPDAVLASAAIPTLFRSVPVDGGLYWDGLFSQNPPVRDLLDARPEEIWVIQINPQERDGEPRTITEITDRRNELSGNLSLFQELHFIEKIDRMLEEGELRSGRFRPVGIRIIEKSRSDKSRRMGAVSKMNRDPKFLAGLIDDGAATAADFLTALDFETAWRTHDDDVVLGFLADDCLVTADDPFAPFSAVGEKAAQFVLERLAREVEIDMTRRQYASDHYLWRVRFVDQSSGERRRGQVGIIIRNGQITRVMLGPAAPDGSIDRRIVL